MPLFATYAFVPSGVTAIPHGRPPTVTVSITVSVVVLITETLLLLDVIYAYEAIDGAFCEVAVDAIETARIKNKIRATKVKTLFNFFWGNQNLDQLYEITLKVLHIIVELIPPLYNFINSSVSFMNLVRIS